MKSFIADVVKRQNLNKEKGQGNKIRLLLIKRWSVTWKFQHLRFEENYNL